MLLSEESIQKIINDQIQKIIPVLQREITNEILKLIVVQEDICPSKQTILEKSSESEELMVEDSPTPPKKEKSKNERKKELLSMTVVELRKLSWKIGGIKGNLRKTDLVDAILKREIEESKKEEPPKEEKKTKKEEPPKKEEKKTKEKKFIVIENEYGILVDKDTGKYIIDKDTNSVFGIFSGKDKYTSLSKKDITLLEKQKIPLYHLKLNISPLSSEDIKNKLFPPSEESSSEESSSSESESSESESSEEEKDISSEESDSDDDGEESETNKKEGDEIKTIEDIFKESFGGVKSTISTKPPPKPVPNPSKTNPPKKLKKKGDISSDSD